MALVDLHRFKGNIPASGSNLPATRRWDERLLFAPLNTLSSQNHWYAIVLATAGTLAWGSLWNGTFLAAWQLPDVRFYILEAQGRYDLVPQPFTSRPLAPLVARGIAAALHCWTEGGFQVLVFLSLLCLLPIVFWLLVRTAAPRWMLLAVAAVPFWPQLLSNAGLPDPLYAALLGALLLALAKQRFWVAALLIFPMMLTRESTWLTLLCLLAVAWRPLRWTGAAAATACALLGVAAVKKLSAGGLPNPEHLSGSTYLVGKLFSNTLRSVGIVPWSNVYPGLCQVPAWQLPLHLGQVSAVGVCAWAPGLFLQAWWALLTVFGALPFLLLATLPGLRSFRSRVRQSLPLAPAGSPDPLLRFCVLYGGISFLLGPILGMSYVRLIGYGWPLFVVALPQLWARAYPPLPDADPSPRQPSWAGALLCLHLLVCAFALRLVTAPTVAAVLCSEIAILALLLMHRRAFFAPRFPL